jgi:hypothetical protein
MTTLQARLIAARAVRAAQEQAEFARSLREDPQIPAQRTPERPTTLHAVPSPTG